MTFTNDIASTIHFTAVSFLTTSSISSFDIFVCTSTCKATFSIGTHPNITAIMLFCTAFINITAGVTIASGALIALTSIAAFGIGTRCQPVTCVCSSRTFVNVDTLSSIWLVTGRTGNTFVRSNKVLTSLVSTTRIFQALVYIRTGAPISLVTSSTVTVISPNGVLAYSVCVTSMLIG